MKKLLLLLVAGPFIFLASCKWPETSASSNDVDTVQNVAVDSTAAVDSTSAVDSTKASKDSIK